MNTEKGFISIVTTSIIMVIVTIMVIGFSQVMQREQRQSLDRQLSSQALYAAETAVNDLYAQLQAGTLIDEAKTDCNVSSWPNSGVVNPGSSNEAAYTCVLYDQAPEFLEFGNGGITTQKSKIFPLQTKGNNPNARIKSITFRWSGVGADKALNLPTNCNATQSNPPTSPTGVPILRVDLLRMPVGSPVDKNTVNNETTTIFMHPAGACGTNSANLEQFYGSAQNKGQVQFVNCNPANDFACEFTIDRFHSASNIADSDRYFTRVKSVYNDADLRIEGESTANGSAGRMEFFGAQVTVDATGRANDVVRRISVQIGNPQYPIPEFVAQGLDGICKGITIAPPSAAISSTGEAIYDCY